MGMKRAAQQLEREKKIKGCALPDSSSHIGPIAPPSLVEYGSRKKDSATENEDDHDHDDDSDEGVLIGPMPTHDDPHGSTKTEWVQLQRSIDERVELMEKKVDEDQNPLAKKIERGEWMTVPPTSRSMHELQSLKSRKFSSKSKGSDFDPTWTQTPQTRHEMASGNLSQLSSKESSIPHESMKKRQRSPPVLPSASTRDRDLSAKVAEYNVVF
ncbi:hypothetical protein HMI54_007574 [Coelomomyces lativittatus]|nr:hypothetical protein HMI54_007574 [Coelomomyces lativittatus]